ncbi:MAG TPA: hypothetical protein VHI99_05470 [Vicinamibacterales bacterium]|nr:hypothetical protein [Vicinamibacterales bacterium]
MDTRPFYAALGQSDNRNRRNRQPGAIKTRLMGLDFVLAHPQHRYLPSEQDKVEYFTRTRNIDRDLLPTKVYRSKNGTSSTARFFVEKFPIFLRQQPGQDVETEVAFCFVDGGATTVSTFENYLCQYARLFAALAQFQVMFVATRPLLFQPAERAFRRVILARRNGEDPSPAGSLSQRLREYFEARQRYESGQLSTFDRAALIRLRDDRETFSGERFESLFEQWKAFSEGGHPERSEAKTTTPSSISGTFSTCLLEHSYDLFGTLTAF